MEKLPLLSVCLDWQWCVCVGVCVCVCMCACVCIWSLLLWFAIVSTQCFLTAVTTGSSLSLGHPCNHMLYGQFQGQSSTSIVCWSCLILWTSVTSQGDFECELTNNFSDTAVSHFWLDEQLMWQRSHFCNKPITSDFCEQIIWEARLICATSPSLVNWWTSQSLLEQFIWQDSYFCN